MSVGNIDKSFFEVTSQIPVVNTIVGHWEDTATATTSADITLSLQIQGNVVFLYQSVTANIPTASALSFVAVSYNGVPVTSLPAAMLPSSLRYFNTVILVGTTQTPVLMSLGNDGTFKVVIIGGTSFAGASVTVTQWQAQYSLN